MSRPAVTELAPHRALHLLSAGLTLSILPLFIHVTPFPLVVMIACIATRLLRDRTRLPSIALWLVILVIGAGAIYGTYGSFIGLEPGVSLLAVMISLKIAEARRPRDFHVLVLLGLFLCLSLLFFSQGLAMTLYAGAVSAILLAALVQAQAGSAFNTGAAARWAVRLLLVALPLICLLFVFSPRTLLGMRFQLQSGLFGASGMSDRLEPGKVASLALSDEVVFRATFIDENVPGASQLYWRGTVLWQCRGLVWLPGRETMSVVQAPPLGGEVIRQQILLQPHGGFWLFALDRPAADFRGAEMRTGNFLRSNRPIFSSLRYEVASRPENRQTAIYPSTRQRALRVPRAISPRVRALAREWRQSSANDDEVVNAALQFFRKNGFVYSLSPGAYDEEGLEAFLFQRKTGFCEHYAAAFATLMRLAGIPSRVVMGYQGGERNRSGDYVIVRQYDAHAWCEVWMEGRGWERVDPTNAVAPERITSGLNSFLASRSAAGNAGGDAAGGSSSAIGFREMLRDARLAWDNLQYQWDLHVVNFDAETQRSLLVLAGLEGAGPANLLVWMILAVVAAVSLLGLWMAWRHREVVEPLSAAYAALCRKSAAAGVLRQPSEGPLSFSRRLSAAFPAAAEDIRAIGEAYIRMRYGERAKGDPGALRRRIDHLRLSPPREG